LVPWHPAQAGLREVHKDSPFSDETPRGPVAALQVPPVGAAQTPFVHEAAAVPVVGPVLSDSEKDAPDAVDAAVALQVLVPTVQLIACAAHATGAGAAQVLDTALQVPFVHAYVAAPVFGALVFCSDAVKPDVV
jgi:hypothetical protein